MMRRMNVRALSEPIPFQMGLQVPCSVCAQAPPESHLWADPAAVGTDLPCAGPTEGMPDSRRAPHAGPCAYVHRHSAETPRGLGNRFPEREECDRDCPVAWEGSKLVRRAFLGSRLRRFPGGI